MSILHTAPPLGSVLFVYIFIWNSSAFVLPTMRRKTSKAKFSGDWHTQHTQWLILYMERTLIYILCGSLTMALNADNTMYVGAFWAQLFNHSAHTNRCRLNVQSVNAYSPTHIHRTNLRSSINSFCTPLILRNIEKWLMADWCCLVDAPMGGTLFSCTIHKSNIEFLLVSQLLMVIQNEIELTHQNRVKNRTD